LNFRNVTEKLLAAFTEHNIRYALIGGYAVGLWGVARGTVDMDFLVERDDQGKLDLLMESLGFKLRYRSENVSQFTAPFGEIDFLHAFRSHSLRMLDRAVEKTLFGNRFAVRVLQPDDLIGLKLQAIANNRDRGHLDMYDIEELMRLHGKTMDWELLKDYFAIFEMHELYESFKEKYHATL